MTLLSKLRFTTTAALLACAINQSPAKALGNEIFHFAEQPTTAEVTQAIAALISVPSTVFALENPDFNTLAFIEHASKAIEEGLSIYNQFNLYNIPWCAYDTTEAIRRLWQTFHTPMFKQEKPIDNNTTEDELAQALKNKQQKNRLKTVIGVLLALIEGGVRYQFACENRHYRTIRAPALSGEQRADISYRRTEKEFWTSMGELARLANYSLYADDNVKMASWLTVFVINAIAGYWLNNRYANHSPSNRPANHTLTPPADKTSEHLWDRADFGLTLNFAQGTNHA